MMKKINIAFCLMVACSVMVFTSCKREVYTPKPRGYFRIALQDKNYQTFDSASYPYTFEYPVYGKIHPVKKEGEQYWLNLEFPAYNATIYISYKHVNNNLPEIIEDNHKISSRHTIKADAMGNSVFIREDARVYGLLTEIDGGVASAIQFYVTDSTKNFVRGSLYFNTTTNSDSLAPLVSYFKKDIQHLMETFEWKTKQ